jgi:glycerol-3-phosphate dehydrogenase (NAD(P)+)
MRLLLDTGAMASEPRVISVSKGLEEGSLQRMSEVIAEELGLPAARVAVLAGPSHAEEVCRRLPTATVAAAQARPFALAVQRLFSTDYFRVYTHTDVAGVELGGTLKNVFAIGCGISDGLGFGDNTRAALMTRGLNEMARNGVRMGAQLLTFFGLAGMGDLIVTCLSRHSRNHQLGEKIGKGLSPGQALAEMTMVAEGYKTAPSADALAGKLAISCPLIHEVYDVLYKGKDPRQSLHDLMSRETPSEWQDLPEGIVQ